jgi:hypothetical protein
MSLSNLLSEIKSNQAAAEMNPNVGPPETLNGRIGMKRNAAETNKRLKRQYRTELMAQVAYIVVTGSNRDAFTEVASGENFGCFTADPDNFFKDLASRMDKSLFGRESTKNLFSIAGNIIEDKAIELDLQSYPMLSFNERYNTTVRSPEEFVPVIRNAVNDQVGSELVGINAVYSVVDEAIRKDYSATVTPVILSTSDERFALDLSKNLKRLTPKVFLVAAGTASRELKETLGTFSVKNPTEDSVGKTLTTIRSKIVQ